MKTILLLIIFLCFNYLSFRLLKNFFIKTFKKNKILFWIYANSITLIVPFILMELFSIKFNNFFYNSLHNRISILIIGFTSSYFTHFTIHKLIKNETIISNKKPAKKDE